MDGGWGTHVECASTMFGAILSYISLRLLGVSAEDPACSKGRQFIRDNGGAVMAPSWAKFWMAVLGVYEWEVRFSVRGVSSCLNGVFSCIRIYTCLD